MTNSKEVFTAGDKNIKISNAIHNSRHIFHDNDCDKKMLDVALLE